MCHECHEHRVFTNTGFGLGWAVSTVNGVLDQTRDTTDSKMRVYDVWNLSRPRSSQKAQKVPERGPSFVPKMAVYMVLVEKLELTPHFGVLRTGCDDMYGGRIDNIFVPYSDAGGPHKRLLRGDDRITEGRDIHASTSTNEGAERARYAKPRRVKNQAAPRGSTSRSTNQGEVSASLGL
ncbi:hypothetical protein BJV77DRAFT_964301 [Russula vinacea]|nr:hypothetical protein BJV77DRAFT_964301 [Russula vinacea]